MANSYNYHAKCLVLDTPDILSFRQNDDPDSGLRSIHIKRIHFHPNAAADTVTFYSLDVTNTAADLTLTNDTFTVAGADRFTDDAGSALDNTKMAPNISWVNVFDSYDTGNNKGWFMLKTEDASDNFIEVQEGTRALTNEASKRYSMSFYTPQVAYFMEADGTEKKAVRDDFGCRGKWFYNLAVGAIPSGAYVYIYLQ